MPQDYCCPCDTLKKDRGMVLMDKDLFLRKHSKSDRELQSVIVLLNFKFDASWEKKLCQWRQQYILDDQL